MYTNADCACFFRLWKVIIANRCAEIWSYTREACGVRLGNWSRKFHWQLGHRKASFLQSWTHFTDVYFVWTTAEVLVHSRTIKMIQRVPLPTVVNTTTNLRFQHYLSAIILRVTTAECGWCASFGYGPLLTVIRAPYVHYSGYNVCC